MGQRLEKFAQPFLSCAGASADLDDAQLDAAESEV
jgi:hypothetical protein